VAEGRGHVRNGPHFTKAAFEFDFEGQTVTCPGGTSLELRLGSVHRFPASSCGACELRGQCTSANPGTGRSLSVHPDEPEQHRRREMHEDPRRSCRLPPARACRARPGQGWTNPGHSRTVPRIGEERVSPRLSCRCEQLLCSRRHFARGCIIGHVSRGHPMWTRPGYNFCLLHESSEGIAVFVWWRPKWEDGRPGTERRDKLRVIECTLFRREGRTPLASDMIRGAVEMLSTDHAREALHLRNAGEVGMLLTGVSSKKTTGGRSPRSMPGACYRHAGWLECAKRTKRADVWLKISWANPFVGASPQPPHRGQRSDNAIDHNCPHGHHGHLGHQRPCDCL